MMNKLLVALAGIGLASSALAAEYPIGEPSELNGLEVAAVYLQPIEMEPAGIMRAAKDSDVHLEADIHTTARRRFPCRRGGRNGCCARFRASR